MARLRVASTSLLSVCLLSGCVTQARHQALLDQAKQDERARADQLEQQASDSRKAHEEAQRELDAERDRAAELELELAQTEQALQASRELVDQLRNELGRVGGHLEHFGDRAKQAAELEKRVDFLDRRLLALMQLANRLVDAGPGEPTRTARIGLSKDGDLVIDVRARTLFLGKSSKPSRRGRELLTQLASLVDQKLGLSLILPRTPKDDEGDPRAEAMREILIKAGASEEAITLVDVDPSANADALRLRLHFGAPEPSAPKSVPEPAATSGEASANGA